MAIMTPTQTARGTESLFPDAAAIRNAVVHSGSDDLHFAAADNSKAPRGVLMHDEVLTGGDLTMKRNIAVFGVYPETLQVTAAAAIAVDAEVIADPANPGQVKTLPATAGTWYVIGRSRNTVAAGGDPVSLIHHVARKVVIAA